ncbi:MAG: homoserine dehydrogenase [Prevotellaceae bacterium]|jgi:homoserine dehydrogenase|nr:homoserine dehydrogenase [Prevotellaceae bacterium]
MITIGLFGFGTVGAGLHTVLQRSKTVDAHIKRICIKNADKARPRSIDPALFTTRAEDILDDPDINLVVELIDNANDAYHIVKTALQQGKSVVSGNKAMLAMHLQEMIELQQKHGAALLYDASACGSIPVIRNLEEYYDNDLLTSITGILNGSSNYILSKIFQHGESYDKALQQAQQLGFAESNPSFDVDGFDSLYKLVILTLHAFGIIVHPDDVFNFGISNIADCDIRYAKEKGRNIKLVARVGKVSDSSITLYVMPRMLTPDLYIYSVEDEYNGVVIRGQFYDKQFMFGKGAGALPTGSAVLSDITARFHDYRYEYKKFHTPNPPTYTTDKLVEIYLRYHHANDFEQFRFTEISERYSCREYSYVVGKIELSNLLSIKKMMKNMNVFLALMSS